MAQYECVWCGGLVNQEVANVVQRRNVFDNWLGNDYYHPSCYQKYLQRKRAEEAKPQSFIEKHFFAIIGCIFGAAVAVAIIPIIITILQGVR